MDMNEPTVEFAFKPDNHEEDTWTYYPDPSGPGALSVVHCWSGLWYFWDETWADRYGPYTTEAECLLMLDRYCRYALDGEPEVWGEPFIPRSYYHIVSY